MSIYWCIDQVVSLTCNTNCKVFCELKLVYFTKHPHLYKQPTSRSVKSLKRKMEKLHSKYVFAPADKAANNITSSLFEKNVEVVIRLIRCVVERRVTGTCYCLLPLKSQSYKVAIYKQLSSKFEKSQQFKIIS